MAKCSKTMGRILQRIRLLISLIVTKGTHDYHSWPESRPSSAVASVLWHVNCLFLIKVPNFLPYL